jgi:hypothetical protein
MKYGAYLWGIVVLSLLVIVFLLVRISSLGSDVQWIRDQNNRELAALQDSLKRAQADLATAKELAPGLGEFMTTISCTPENSGLPLRRQIGNWRTTSLMS